MTCVYIVSWCVIWGVATYKIISIKGYVNKNIWFLYGFVFGILGFVCAVKRPIIDEHDKNKNTKPGDWICQFCGIENGYGVNYCICGKTKRTSIEAYSKKWSKSSKKE